MRDIRERSQEQVAEVMTADAGFRGKSVLKNLRQEFFIRDRVHQRQRLRPKRERPARKRLGFHDPARKRGLFQRRHERGTQDSLQLRLSAERRNDRQSRLKREQADRMQPADMIQMQMRQEKKRRLLEIDERTRPRQP